jgi:hypothetical protein
MQAERNQFIAASRREYEQDDNDQGDQSGRFGTRLSRMAYYEDPTSSQDNKRITT